MEKKGGGVRLGFGDARSHAGRFGRGGGVGCTVEERGEAAPVLSRRERVVWAREGRYSLMLRRLALTRGASILKRVAWGSSKSSVGNRGHVPVRLGGDARIEIHAGRVEY